MRTIVCIDATIKCPHTPFGKVPFLPPIVSKNTRVKILGQYVFRKDDDFKLAVGCTHSNGTNVHRCDDISWNIPEPRVFVSGNPVILNDSEGIIQSGGLPQTPPPTLAKIDNPQTRVRAK